MSSKLVKLMVLAMIITSLSACSAWDSLRGHDDDDDGPRIDEKKLEQDINKQFSKKDKEELNEMVENHKKFQNITVKPVYK